MVFWYLKISIYIKLGYNKIMDILPTNEYKEVEGRYYVNPQISLDESNTFIDNLRTSQGQQNQEIFSDTRMLGTDVPSNLGGLTGADSYFTSRYQVPQTNAAAANLRAAAQASALNQVLEDQQSMWKKRYNDAYRAYQKSAYNKTNSPSSSLYDIPEGEDPDYSSTSQVVGSVEPQFSPAGSGNYIFTPSSMNNNSLDTGNPMGVNNLIPAGSVTIVRNSGGGIESLTYNGKTFTGDAARQRFDFLTKNGTLSRAED